MIKIFCGILLFFIAAGLQAKELKLILSAKSQYPMSVHYKFSNGNTLYAQGDLKNLKTNKKYFIFVNQVLDDKKILIQVDKMAMKNVVVFNDPCELYLEKNRLTATITVGFEGDPNPEKHQGRFICNVSN